MQPKVYGKRVRQCEVIIGPSIAYVPLTKGQLALIDVASLPLVASHNWHAQWNPKTKSYYATRSKWNKLTKTNGVELMHAVILGKLAGHTVDHKNGQTLHNFAANLRHATPFQQLGNMGPSRRNKFGIKGIYLCGKDRYRASIKIGGKNIHLGYFKSPVLAGQAYAIASKEHWGEFARIP